MSMFLRTLPSLALLLLLWPSTSRAWEKNVLELASEPDSVADWSPLISQAVREAGEGGTLHFPGPRTYPVVTPVVLEHGVSLRFASSATLIAGTEVSSLFVLRKGKRFAFSGVGGRALLTGSGKAASLIDLRELSPENVPDLLIRQIHFRGYRCVDGMAPLGERYVKDQGSLGEVTIEDCRFDASDAGIGHERGTIRSLRVENNLFSGARVGVYVTCPITEGVWVRGNRLNDVGVRGIHLGGGVANLIDDGAVEHIHAATVHDNHILGGGNGAGEKSSYIWGILVYGTNVSIQGNIVRDFNRGEPVPGERVGHHFKMDDGSYHRGPWIEKPGAKPRRLAGSAIYAKARNGIIANNVCTNSGWRAVIEVKTGGREPFVLVSGNVVDGRSLSIDDSFGFEANVDKSLWVNNLLFNMPNMAIRISNRMKSAYMNNVIYDSKVGFGIGSSSNPTPELIANNHFVNVPTPVAGLRKERFTAAVTPVLPIIVESEAALPVPGESERGRIAFIRGEERDRLVVGGKVNGEYVWLPMGDDDPR